MDKTKIALVDDHQMFRDGLRLILEKMDHIDIKLSLSNGQEFLTALETEDIDLVLLDIEMPIMNGRECLSILKVKYPELKVIMLSMNNSTKHMLEFVKEGAHAYLLKETGPDELAEAIEKVMTKGTYMNENLSEAFFSSLQKTASHKSLSSDLSNREVEVLQLICEEKTNSEIAELLFLSSRTVENHRRHLLDKTNSRNTAGLVKYAILHNLI